MIGATIAVERWPMALSRVSMRTDRCLPGDGNRQTWTSPRFNLPAKTRPPPRDDILLSAEAGLDNRAGRAPRVPPDASASDVPGERGESAQIDLLFGAWLRCQRPSRVWRPERLVWFPVWESIHSIFDSEVLLVSYFDLIQSESVFSGCVWLGRQQSRGAILAWRSESFSAPPSLMASVHVIRCKGSICGLRGAFLSAVLAADGRIAVGVREAGDRMRVLGDPRGPGVRPTNRRRLQRFSGLVVQIVAGCEDYQV